jgi:hypothetical protein
MFVFRDCTEHVLDKLHEASAAFEVPVIVFRSMESFGDYNEYEIIAEIIKTIDEGEIISLAKHMMQKEHQYTLFFSKQNESIVPTLLDRGMIIKNVVTTSKHIEIELFPKLIF